MVKIALIGAGSVVFTRKLCSDLLLVPALAGCEIALMDIDPALAELARRRVQAIAEARAVPATITATSDRREAVRGAAFVITTFLVGGTEAYTADIEIPARYGVGQVVGDTLGPGGVFRALRTIPVLLDLCRDLDELAPDALLLNYVNPMAANCWAVARATGRPHVGLCHSVQGDSKMLADWIGVPINEVAYRCAGINHQAFFLEFRRGGEDLYPAIRAAVARPEVAGEEPVRIDLFRAFGYFVTESSAHASEYVPYFRKNERMIEEELAPRFTDPNDPYDGARTGSSLRNRIRRPPAAEAPERPLPTERSDEYGAAITEAVVGGTLARINGNVPNGGLITNLPRGCCVEVPCLVDANGVQPTTVGALPPQLAALNRTNVNVQELIVEAALTGKVEHVHHAVMLDPLTAAVCTLPQIEAMVGELLAAEARWLPPALRP